MTPKLCVRQHPLHTGCIGIMNQYCGSQLAFPLGCFLGQDVPSKTLGTLELTGSGSGKAFRRPPVGLHFGHRYSLHCKISSAFEPNCFSQVPVCFPLMGAATFFGARTMTINLPSILGNCSTTLNSDKSASTRFNNFIPNS